MSNIIVIEPTNCIDAGGSIVNFCLPIKEICIKAPEGLTVECGQQWNCNLCQTDSEYHIPYIQGDLIQIQTLLFDGFNADRQNPLFGFSPTSNGFIEAIFCDSNGVETHNFNLFSSRQMVAYGCGRSYQILEVDTSLLAPNICWSIRYVARDSGGTITQEICTQEFKDVTQGCPETFTIQGKRSEGIDCFGYCYSEPDAFTGDLIQYNNTIRFHGYFKATGGTVDFTEVGDKVATETIRDIYRLQMGKKVPPFVEKIIRKQMLASKFVCIDGVDYEIEPFGIENELDTGRMFLFNVDLFAECEVKTGCRNL